MQSGIGNNILTKPCTGRIPATIGLFVQAGMQAREQALYAALDDMENWLATGVALTARL